MEAARCVVGTKPPGSCPHFTPPCAILPWATFSLFQGERTPQALAPSHWELRGLNHTALGSPIHAALLPAWAAPPPPVNPPDTTTIAVPVFGYCAFSTCLVHVCAVLVHVCAVLGQPETPQKCTNRTGPDPKVNQSPTSEPQSAPTQCTVGALWVTSGAELCFSGTEMGHWLGQ